MNKDLIINKIVKDLPVKGMRSQMSDVEWFGWFEEVWDKAINNTHCCTELKDKDRIAFHVFAEINKYTKCFEGYKRDGKTFSETEVLKRYNTYLQNL